MRRRRGARSVHLVLAAYPNKSYDTHAPAVHNGVVPVWPAPPGAELNQTVPKVVKEQPDGLSETLSVPMNVFPSLAAAAAHAGAVVIG